MSADDVIRAESPEFATSRKHYEYALRLVNALDSSTSHAVILDVMALQAQSFIDLGHADRLGNVISAAKHLAEVSGDSMRTATFEHFAARAKYFTGEDRAAIPDSDRALAAQRSIGGDGTKHPEPTRLYRELLNHVEMLQGLGLDVDALPFLRLAERILPQVRDPQRKSIALDYAFASLLMVLGDVSSSSQRLNDALAKAIELSESGWQSEIFAAIAALQLEQGETEKAISSLIRYRSMSAEASNSLAEATAEVQLAHAYTLMGKVDEALKSAKRALVIFDSLDDTFNRADARRATAHALALKGDPRAASDMLSQALKFRPENASVNWSYFVSKVRTAIAIAGNDAAAARLAVLEENKRALARDIFNRSAQTKVLREYHEVNTREVQLEALRKEGELREADMRRDQIRILWQRIAIIASVLLLAVVATLLAYFFVRARRLRITADTDALTGVYSRAAILTNAASMCNAAQQQGRSVGACVLDIDQFKRFNDMHGHATGDRVLTQCVGVMQQNVRQGDVIGRIGGDEFLIVMDNIDEAHAVATANRILAALRVTTMGAVDEDLHPTMSAGVSAFVPNQSDSARNLIRQADTALLEAKKRGKNRVMAYTAIVDGSAITHPASPSDAISSVGR